LLALVGEVYAAADLTPEDLRVAVFDDCWKVAEPQGKEDR
jgi:hypothetical protein